MKTNSKYLKYRTVVWTALAAVFIAGYANAASPPTEQIAVAKAAVANAVSAGASDLAPLEMKIARDKLDRTLFALAKSENDKARTLAEQTELDAKLAEVKARSVKAQKAAAASADDTRVLGEELDRKN
jgi:hypothetical protein